MTLKVPLVHYLFTRLRQLGIESVNGVPGDFNLVSLDYLAPAGLKWIGDANELNAGTPMQPTTSRPNHCADINLSRIRGRRICPD